jgi:5'-nucleotidase
MNSTRPQILLSNDDGIQSPGLWAAAAALSKLGYVTIAAPRRQYSGAGRSIPIESDGRIEKQTLCIEGQEWPAYAIGGSPAQAVMHGVLEILPNKPDLVVSGINYGENIGNSIMISGTVGAAMEGASLGIPSLAVSLELKGTDYLTYDQQVDFSTAGYFTAYFARLLLENSMPADVDFLKVDVPADATPETEWVMTRVSRSRYFMPTASRKGPLHEDGAIGFYIEADPEVLEPDSDVFALAHGRQVSVTPLSIDNTSRVDLAELQRRLKGLAE